ncbi:MAG: hypothetical protein R3251_00575 [Candidatus Spechtbacterales bacterium]|nr:hypothetical protein [Candidatus Spechtbacterales bacterium]
MTAVIQTAKKKYYREVITIGLILSFLLLSTVFSTAQAGVFTGERDTLSNSRPGVNSNHTVRFVTDNAFAVDETLVIAFDSTFDGSSLTEPGDFDLSYGGASGDATEVLLTAGAPSATEWRVEADNTVITFITASAANTLPGSGEIVVVEIGTNADAQTQGTNQMVNPSKVAAEGTADILNVNLTYDANGVNDTGTALVAIIEGVTVSATVAETLSARIETDVDANCDATFGSQDNSGSVTNTSVTYGTLTADQFRHECQKLIVSTNAANGFSATSQENTALYESSAGNTIDNFAEGSASPTTGNTWSTTYGFGYACSNTYDGGIQSGVCSETNSLNFRPFADRSISQDPAEFLSSAGATTNTSLVNYRIRVSADQQAGDYSNIVTYVFTPTF